MDEESVLPASMPTNSISKTEDKAGKSTQITEEMIDQLGVYKVDYFCWNRVQKRISVERTDQFGVYQVDYPFLKVVQKLIHAPFYLPLVLLAAIICSEEPIYFIYSSFISMLLDPLFLYIPLINEETKCLKLDKKVMVAALILRVVTDLRYVVKIIYKIMRRWQNANEKLGITSNVIAILQIQQLVILVFLPK